MAMTARGILPGKTVQLPGGGQPRVTDSIVSESSRLPGPSIDGEPTRTPFSVHRVDGTWKVNASALVAARQAAGRMREGPGPGRSDQQ